MQRLIFGLVGLVAMASAAPALDLVPVADYQTGIPYREATGAFAYSPASQNFYLIDKVTDSVELLRYDEGAMVSAGSWTAEKLGGSPSAIAAFGPYVAVALDKGTEPGVLLLLDPAGTRYGFARLGVNPSGIAFSPDGTMLAVANEGRPSPDYATDPEGSITLVSLPVLRTTQVTFGAVERDTLDRSIHFASPAGTTLAQDFEPEQLAFSPDGSTLYVTLQENNGLAILDVASGTLSVTGLGYEDFSAVPVDVSDLDGRIRLTNWPVLSMLQPAGIATYQWRGRTLVVTANEGTPRDYPGYSELTRVRSLNLDPVLYPNHFWLQYEHRLGRLLTTTARGDADGDGDVDTIFGFGGRNFSILGGDGARVYDPGSRIERHIAAARPDIFNSFGEALGDDLRSDDMGIEPRGLALASILGRTYIFLGLKRTGGIAAFDITSPVGVRWLGYFNDNDGSGAIAMGTSAPAGPTDLAFIPAGDSPIGDDMLAVAYGASGSFVLYRID